MKYTISVVLMVLLSFRTNAQNAEDKGIVTLSAKEKPQYLGGEKELKKYLSLNLRYPNQAMEQKVQGEVMVCFQIDEQGNISDIKTTRGIGFGCDEEAVRVVKAMPQWQPAHLNGKAVKVTYMLPVVFELPEYSGSARD